MSLLSKSPPYFGKPSSQALSTFRTRTFVCAGQKKSGAFHRVLRSRYPRHNSGSPQWLDCLRKFLKLNLLKVFKCSFKDDCSYQNMTSLFFCQRVSNSLLAFQGFSEIPISPLKFKLWSYNVQSSIQNKRFSEKCKIIVL